MPKSGKLKRIKRELTRVAIVAGTAAGAVFGGPQILDAIRTQPLIPPDVVGTLPAIGPPAGGDELSMVQWAVMVLVAAVIRAFWSAPQPQIVDRVADHPGAGVTPQQHAIIEAHVAALLKQRKTGTPANAPN